MNIDLAVVAEQLNNLKTGIDNVIIVFQKFPLVIQDFGEAFTSDAWDALSSSDAEAPAQGE